MISQVVKSSQTILPEIERYLKAGEVVILPTNTVYALVANGYDLEAVNRLRQIKKFLYPQPLVIFTRYERAEEVVQVDRSALQMMNHFPYPVIPILHEDALN